MSLRRCLVWVAFLAASLPLLFLQSAPEPARAAPAPRPKDAGSFKGRVTLAGDPPNLKALDERIKVLINANLQDKDCCLLGTAEETGQQEWRIGKDKGVGNVFVWLAPLEGQHFKLDWDKKPWPKEVVIDQPHCAFMPHAVVLFPGAYEDGETMKKSGQVLVVKNSAPINHNVHWQGGDLNPGDNKLIPSKEKSLEITNLKPSDEPLLIACDIHKWMTAVVRIYDHPYATVTDKDGNFEIKNAPTGVELRVFVWHEAADNPKKGKEVGKVTLDNGRPTEKKYTIKAK